MEGRQSVSAFVALRVIIGWKRGRKKWKPGLRKPAKGVGEQKGDKIYAYVQKWLFSRASRDLMLLILIAIVDNVFLD